jgi:CheY-like chemotaxis protein
MKVLLIDDEAKQGWYEVINKVLFPDTTIDCAIDIPVATQLLLNNQYDIILLDLRFGETDHVNSDIVNFGGYQVLTTLIRDSFVSLNFPTPVILFTASNKAWHIFDMIDRGVDDFYIKEHPEFINEDFSRKNYLRLLAAITSLSELGKQRREVWQKILDIARKAEVGIENKNIQSRIFEKLIIGYGLLFRKITKLETKQLLFNNETIAFIVFWSVLEEISHDFFSRENELDIEWALRRDKKKLQWIDDENNIRTLFPSIKDNINSEITYPKTGQSHQINLSYQITAILRYQNKWPVDKIRMSFLEKFNKFRNDIDFIHSDTQNILNSSLSKHYDPKVGYAKCIQILSFIEELLSSE